MKKFARKFGFRESGKLLVGIERECFLTDKSGNIVPRAAEILKHFPDRKRFGYELSACQFEDRIGPVKIKDVKKALLQNERDIKIIENRLGFKRLHVEVAPETMPLDVYPDPTGRYQNITQSMSQLILLAACRVVGTHVHIGMPAHGIALKVYNSVIKHTEALCKLGDGSNGERLRIYKIMAPNFQSPPYASWEEFRDTFVANDFADDPRRCWNLIRISVHGTIEFRMFGATPDLNKIVEWARTCHQLCQEAMEA